MCPAKLQAKARVRDSTEQSIMDETLHSRTQLVQRRMNNVCRVVRVRVIMRVAGRATQGAGMSVCLHHLSYSE